MDLILGVDFFQLFETPIVQITCPSDCWLTGFLVSLLSASDAGLAGVGGLRGAQLWHHRTWCDSIGRLLTSSSARPQNIPLWQLPIYGVSDTEENDWQQPFYSFDTTNW